MTPQRRLCLFTTLMFAATFGLATGVARSQDDDPLGSVVEVGGETIHFTLPEIEGLRRIGSGGLQHRHWTAKTSRQQVIIRVHVYPPAHDTWYDPADIVRSEVFRLDAFDNDVLLDGLDTHEYLDNRKTGLARAYLAGGFVSHPEYGTGEILLLAALLKKRAFSVTVTRYGTVDADTRDALVAFVRTGIRAKVLVHDPKRKGKRAIAWLDDLLPQAFDVKKFKPVIRTKHFVVFSNSKLPRSHGKALERTYTRVREMIPFDEPKERALIAGIVFANRGEYVRFSEATDRSEWIVEQSAGHAGSECFVTHTGAGVDTLTHEAAHALVSGRAFLIHGGSWFHEGLAELATTTDDQRREWASRALDESRVVSLRELIRAKRMIEGVGRIDGNDAYRQAALVMAFLRDGRQPEGAFTRMVHAIGMIRAKNADAQIAALEEAYGMSLADLDFSWRAYWRTR